MGLSTVQGDVGLIDSFGTPDRPQRSSTSLALANNGRRGEGGRLIRSVPFQIISKENE